MVCSCTEMCSLQFQQAIMHNPCVVHYSEHYVHVHVRSERCPDIQQQQLWPCENHAARDTMMLTVMRVRNATGCHTLVDPLSP